MHFKFNLKAETFTTWLPRNENRKRIILFSRRLTSHLGCLLFVSLGSTFSRGASSIVSVCQNNIIGEFSVSMTGPEDIKWTLSLFGQLQPGYLVTQFMFVNIDNRAFALVQLLIKMTLAFNQNSVFNSSTITTCSKLVIANHQIFHLVQGQATLFSYYFEHTFPFLSVLPVTKNRRTKTGGQTQKGNSR